LVRKLDLDKIEEQRLKDLENQRQRVFKMKEDEDMREAELRKIRQEAEIMAEKSRLKQI
jgi:hypothetical protein